MAKQKGPRASTTDATARAMKMAESCPWPEQGAGFARPTTLQIVAVDIDTSGSDRGLARPALEQLRAVGTRPSDYLVDGGFTKNEDIEWAHQRGINLWRPPAQSKRGGDPYAPRSDDRPGVADWPHGTSPWAKGPRRMASDPGKALYKQRSQAECPNAWARRMGLVQLGVRGRQKARAVLLWFASRRAALAMATA